MPTVFKIGKYRFFFNSREEKRMHIHISTADGTAKFWVEPMVGLSDNYNLSTKDLKRIKQIVEEKQDEIIKSWKKHFEQ